MTAMAPTNNEIQAEELRRFEDLRRYYVVHPLDDVVEEKRSPEGLGAMHLSRSQKLALMSLRGYLVLMTAMVVLKAVALSGLLG